MYLHKLKQHCTIGVILPIYHIDLILNVCTMLKNLLSIASAVTMQELCYANHCAPAVTSTFIINKRHSI
jgi:hypothetical protein